MLSRRGFIRSLTAIAAAPSVALPSAEALAAPSERPAAWPADTDPGYWAAIRKQFDLRADEVFLNTATLGAPARVVNDAVAGSMRDLTRTLAEFCTSLNSVPPSVTYT